MLALDHGWDVIGLAADTANSWALHHSLHALATLEVGGTQGKEIWGNQWIKLLTVLYDGVTTGIPGTEKLIGGVTPEGTAARVRVQLEIERIMATNP